MNKRLTICLSLAISVAIGFQEAKPVAQPLPAPTPAPGSPDLHIFYGETPPGGQHAPVLVFLHGLRGRAADWWENNDMYEFAHRAGYRTAFVSLSRDNTPNEARILDNANVIEDALPKIATRYGIDKFFVIAHSKGGLDVEAAISRGPIASLVRAVFTVSTPNTGTELADWAFGPGRAAAGPLGLLTPAVADLRTGVVKEFRQRVDPVLNQLQIPFYTMKGITSRDNPLLRVTGRILTNLTGKDIDNDGLVPANRTSLPIDYAVDVGAVFDNHFRTDSGNRVFPRINAYLQQYLLGSPDFKKVVSNGFGDPANTWFWSQAWYKGKLYVGTAQSQHCLTFATAAIRLEGLLQKLAYPPPGGDFFCTPDMRDLPLAAEIWQYTPETRRWRRVYKSPNDVPVKFDPGGGVTGFTGRDVGFRDMVVFREMDGTEALYVAGIGASSAFDLLPYYQTNPYPSPRILRSVDGVNFAPVPADPGTFLGDLVKNSPEDYKIRGFRSFTVLNEKLFVTASDYRGVGRILASANPEQGNEAWFYAGPTAAEMPVWTLETFNDHVYAVTGDRRFPTGYEVHKTDATGDSPYDFTQVVSAGAGQSLEKLRALNGLSLEVFQGKLYVGTDRQTEMIRVNPDDTWEIVSGYPRDTPDGYKAPISGINQWFGNYFNGHLWRMTNWNNRLYVGTWDWSVHLSPILVLDALFAGQYGSDVYSTGDGVHWRFETRQGFGHPWNIGTRSWASTPFGLFVGTAKPKGGADLFVNQSIFDFDEDGDIDAEDVLRLRLDATGGPAAGPDDPRDIDRDGRITNVDVRKLQTQCTRRNCTVINRARPKVPAATHLAAASAFLVGRERVSLSWDEVPGAAEYIIYRGENRPVIDLFPKDLTINLPPFGKVAIPDDFVAGRPDIVGFCALDENSASLVCLLNTIFKLANQTTNWLGMPVTFLPVARTPSATYAEPAATTLQSLYFVVAEDAEGRRSQPSNFVGGPSWALPETLSTVRASLRGLAGQGADATLLARAQTQVAAAERALSSKGAAAARLAIADELNHLDEWMVAHPRQQAAAVDVQRVLRDVADSLRFIERGKYPADAARLASDDLIRSKHGRALTAAAAAARLKSVSGIQMSALNETIR